MEKDLALEPQELLRIIWKKLWLILIITCLSTGIAYSYSRFLSSPIYEAKATIIIGNSPRYIEAYKTEFYEYSDVLMYQQLAATYGEIAESMVVAEKTAKKLGNGTTAEQVVARLTCETSNESQIITLRSQSDDRWEAMDTVNIAADVFIEEAMKILSTGSIQIMDKAVLPSFPISPRVRLNTIIGACFGGLLSLGLIILKYYLDNSIKSEKDVEKHLCLPVMGIIPEKK